MIIPERKKDLIQLAIITRDHFGYRMLGPGVRQWGNHQGLGATSNGFGTHPRTWIREAGRKGGWGGGRVV